MQSDFGPWNYRGYAIERYCPEDGPVEFIVVSKNRYLGTSDDIASFYSKSAAEDFIDDIIEY